MEPSSWNEQAVDLVNVRGTAPQVDFSDEDEDGGVAGGGEPGALSGLERQPAEVVLALRAVRQTGRLHATSLQVRDPIV